MSNDSKPYKAHLLLGTIRAHPNKKITTIQNSEENMNQEQLHQLAVIIATHVNTLVNLPLLNEEDEQLLFQFLIYKALEIFWVLTDKTQNEGV
jgi:hypothetical protein